MEANNWIHTGNEGEGHGLGHQRQGHGHAREQVGAKARLRIALKVKHKLGGLDRELERNTIAGASIWSTMVLLSSIVAQYPYSML